MKPVTRRSAAPPKITESLAELWEVDSGSCRMSLGLMFSISAKPYNADASGKTIDVERVGIWVAEEETIRR